jgi:D-alanyl-D-alanine dipeptidase
LWQRVVGTDKQRYVANPAKGSIHNYGFAVDLGVIDQDGHELDTGTGFDSFEPVSQPALEDKYTRSGQLSPAQLAKRKILRSVMQQAGFIQLPLEWWHFDALPSADVHQHYHIIE